MPIARNGKFLVTSTLGGPPRLGLESATLSECIQEVLDRPYRGVFGSPHFGFHETTLDALLKLPHLEEIWFWDISLDNVDAVYTLKGLKSFGVHPKRPPIDFSRLPSLERLVVTYKPADQGIDRLSGLRSFHLWHYSPKPKTFGDLRLPQQLTELQINWANPMSLKGLNPVPSLRRLEIHRCRNLESLAEIPSLFPNLEYLVVSTCGRIKEEEGSSCRASETHACVCAEN
jgi:hypothetical protein